jgi:putative ubiquitin-RnfH superfamily antitoxin RatB of RatAB toxin-antitoxin module
MGPVEGRITVEVVYCPVPHQIDQTRLQLSPGSCVADALRDSGVLLRQRLVARTLSIGVWCRSATVEQPLRDRDRVEIYRALLVDPKEARRQRYKGKRGAAR